MNSYDVVKKIIGPISPVGETNTDDERFENLKSMCELIDRLLFDISSVAGNKDAYEYSVKRAGLYAQKQLDEIKEAF